MIDRSCAVVPSARRLRAGTWAFTLVLLTAAAVGGQSQKDLLEGSAAEAFERAFAEGAFDRALAAARGLERQDPATGSLLAARALLALGAPQQAERAARKADALRPDLASKLLLASALDGLDRPEEAIETLVAAIAETNDESVRSSVSERLALLHLEQGRTGMALEALQGLEQPADPGVLGLIYAAMPERFDQAEATLRTALSRADEDSPVSKGALHRALGQLLAERRPVEAVRELELALGASEPTPDVVYQLANLHRALGDDEQATQRLTEFQRLRAAEDEADAARRVVGTAINEAQELANSNRLTEASDRIAGIVAEHPRSYSARALQAKVLFSLGRAEEALGAIVEARELAPSVVEFHYLEGLFARTVGDASAARSALEHALALDPDLAEAHAILGGILLQQGDPESSLHHLDRAVALGAGGDQIERARALARDRLDDGL